MGTDGLDWMLDIDAQVDGPIRLLSTLDRIDATLKKLDGGLGKTAKGTEHAGEKHRKHGKDVEHLESAFDRLIHKAMEPFLHKAKEIAEFEFIREGAEKLLELPGELAEKIHELGEEMLKTGAKAERTSKAFELSFGDKQGRGYEEWIDKFAHKSELAEDSVKGVGLELGKVGLKAEQWKRAIEASADMAALSKSGEEGFAAAAAGYEMLARTGRANDRVLHGLGFGQDDFFRELSDRTGEGIATLKAKIDAGKFDVNASLEALNALVMKKTHKDLGGAAMDAGELMEAKLKNLHEAPEKILEKAKDAKGWGRLTEAMGHIGEQLGPEGKTGNALGKEIMEFVDLAAPLVEKLPGQIDKITESFKGMDIVLHDIADMGHKVIEVVEVIDRFTPAFAAKATKSTFADFGPKFKALENGTLKATPGERARLVEDALAAARADVEADKPWAWRAVESSGHWLKEKFFGLGESSGDGLAGGMSSKADKVEKAGGGLGGAGAEGTRKSIDSHSPSKVFADIGEDTVDGFVLGVRGSRGKLERALSIMGDDLPVGGRDRELERALSSVTMLPPPTTSRAAVASSAPPFAVTFTANITVNGAEAPDEAAQEVARAVERISETALVDVLERFALRRGVGGGP